MTEANARGYIQSAAEYALELAGILNVLGLKDSEVYARDLRGHLCDVASRGGVPQTPLRGWYTSTQETRAIDDGLTLIKNAAPGVEAVTILCDKIATCISCAYETEGGDGPRRA